MTYTLQAIVADVEVLEAVVPTGYPVVTLEQGKGMIPLIESIRIRTGLSFLPLTDEGETSVPEPVVALCRAFSGRGKVAYIEAEFFGGTGTQACVLATQDRVEAPYVDPGAINRALLFLGVARGRSVDEFEAVGLGRHRDTEDWVSGRGA